MKNELKIFLASPRGFCAGVERAIEIVNKTLLKYGKPIYVRHEIVHNKQVVEDLKTRGAIFVEEISEIKDLTRPVIFSAHGVPKTVPEEAKLKNLFYIDATCPLVSKVHRESEQLFKNGFDIILIGHKNHPEVIGTMGQLPEGAVTLIETSDNVASLKSEEFKKPLAYITQTTLSVDDTFEIIKRLKNKFPKIKGPIKEDICYATTNRQNAVKQIAPNCDMFFVIGSRNSSNSVRLVEVAKKAGCVNSELIHSGKKLPIAQIKKSKIIGISSGASAPEQLVQTLISEIKKNCKVFIEEIIVAEEKVVFKLPKELNKNGCIYKT
jgi:4-hydroxy-3-methylbut-2-enyl diphosphate reductase